MRKSQRFIDRLALVGIATNLLVAGPLAIEKEREVLATQVETLEETKIVVPLRIYEKATSDIDWIFENGYAGEISRKDFYHFHILIPKHRLSMYPDLNKSNMINDPSVVLLYHTRELPPHTDDYPDRNILSRLEGEPQLIKPEWFRDTSKPEQIGTLLWYGTANPTNGIPIYQDKHTVYLSDLDFKSITGMYFREDPEGSYQLKDGRTITFELPEGKN